MNVLSYKRPQTAINVHNGQRTLHNIAVAKYGQTGGGSHHANVHGAHAVQMSMLTAKTLIPVCRWPVTQKMDGKRLPYLIYIHIH